jgi:hypothetical protein
MGHAGVDSCGGTCETIATLMNFAFFAPIRLFSLMGALSAHPLQSICAPFIEKTGNALLKYQIARLRFVSTCSCV